MKVKTLAVAIAALAFIGGAQAQNARTKTFPLNKEFTAQVVVCAEEGFAKEIADDDTAVTFQVYALVGVCGGGTVRVTYIRPVYKGSSTNVYEVRINGHKAYAITDWTHEST